MNEDKFTGKADIYNKYRPRYANSFIDYLYNESGFKGTSVIADIGSGTGILSKQLAERGSTVYCVEPNLDMSEKARDYFAEFNNCIHTAAGAEATTLRDNSVDFITVAQAFHWFGRQRFREECDRILRHGGKVVLVWNSRGSDDLMMENDMINKKHCPHYEGFPGGNSVIASQEYISFFTDGQCDYREFNNDILLDLGGFVGRNLSSSYAPKEHDDGYSEYVTALKRLFAKYSINDYVTMKNTTVSYVGF